MRAEMYELHHDLENSHWWFTARREIVLALLRAEIAADAALRRPLRILDVGCGAGGMLEHLAALGHAIGIDPAPAAVEFGLARGLDVRRGALPNALPLAPPEAFDLITLLDVVEHVDDDAAALRTLHGLLQPGGRLIVTVPAFQFLWSGHDVVNEHRRRYHRRQLARRLTAAGFDIVRLSYYNTVLFPPIAAVRVLRRLLRPGSVSASDASPDLGRVSAPLNAILHHVFAAERFIVCRMALPFGVSLVAVARPGRAGRDRT